jgi:Cu(I)/Ag(I) efflux system membrane fusion protein
MPGRVSSPRPVASLKWPAMTMDFKLANPALSPAQPGARHRFEFVERRAGRMGDHVD